jgi:hypothetical protein
MAALDGSGLEWNDGLNSRIFWPVSVAHRDQTDPRQSFGAHLQGDARLARQQRAGRFEFVFTPKHGLWLNLVEGFFSKLTRSVLRHIRVASKQELKDRLMAAVEHFNQHPVAHAAADVWIDKTFPYMAGSAVSSPDKPRV